MPVLGNLFGNEQRVLAALELEYTQELRELGQEFAFLRNPSLPDNRQSALDVVPGFARLAHVTPGRRTLPPGRNTCSKARMLILKACRYQPAGRKMPALDYLGHGDYPRPQQATG